MRNYVVYKITNTINDKIYIGITNNTKLRWSSNGKQYRARGVDKNSRPFWNAIQKYGWEKFDKKVILSNLTYEEALQKEIEMIKSYDSTNKNKGYNVSLGGNGGLIYKIHPKGMLGKHHSKEHKEMHSKRYRDKSINPMTNGQVKWGVTHNHPKGMLGKHHSLEKRNQISETLKRKGYSKKKVKVETSYGEVMIFDSLGETADYFGLCRSGKLSKLVKSGEPYKLSKGTAKNKEQWSKLVGYKFKYMDDTEVTIESKTSIVP